MRKEIQKDIYGDGFSPATGKPVMKAEVRNVFMSTMSDQLAATYTGYGYRRRCSNELIPVKKMEGAVK